MIEKLSISDIPTNLALQSAFKLIIFISVPITCHLNLNSLFMTPSYATIIEKLGTILHNCSFLNLLYEER